MVHTYVMLFRHLITLCAYSLIPNNYPQHWLHLKTKKTTVLHIHDILRKLCIK